MFVVSDAYAESRVHLIIGLVIGGTALVLFLMLIAVFFSYRQVLCLVVLKLQLLEFLHLGQ